MPAADSGTEAWSAWLPTRTTDQRARARELGTAIKAGGPGQGRALLERWNELETALGNAFAVAGLMQQVHPDAAMRAQAETAESAAATMRAALSLGRELI